MTPGPVIWLSAYGFQLAFPWLVRLFLSSPAMEFATRPIAEPETILVPTRHGPIKSLILRPPPDLVTEWSRQGRLPPVHVQIAGGAFIGRYPELEANVGRYLASEVGCCVVLPGYRTAPQASFPVAEQQIHDVVQWLHGNGALCGWDGDHLSVGGGSAGGKLALNAVQQAIDAAAFVPLALTVEYALCDVALTDEFWCSLKRSSYIRPWMLRLMRSAYFTDRMRLVEPLASPARYDRLTEFPPTLITTGGLDILHTEMDRLAARLAAEGVTVTHHRFESADHGYTHMRPIETAAQAIFMIGQHLRRWVV
ncbi:alpha/beta hydrolase fold domain-containing protein [Allorhizocola rhizosphaerae]|uniref:alpha/beta hydrolase fold domain-containing protein n=1 Tax=Allorhizocola rhizosphaerae TaxID=1872709 RepID=UPI0013C2A3A3|nr:alpha/beta hydrolase [Allorhizocola rhizosphaerae]